MISIYVSFENCNVLKTKRNMASPHSFANLTKEGNFLYPERKKKKFVFRSGNSIYKKSISSNIHLFSILISTSYAPCILVSKKDKRVNKI